MRNSNLKFYNFSQPLELPPSLFSCKSLKTLIVQGEIILNCPSSVHLPNLLLLSLIRIKYTNDESSLRLLTGSPRLHKLAVCRNSPDNMITLNFSHPNLNMFLIKSRIQDPRFKLQINAPSLKWLFFRDRYWQDYLIHNTTNIVKANINGLFDHENYSHNILKLLRALPNVQSLILQYIKVHSFLFDL